MFTSDPLRRCGQPAAVARDQTGPYRTSGILDAVDVHLSRSLDELDDTAIRAEMALNEQLVRRLNARNAAPAETLVRRQARRNRDANPGDLHAGQKATRQVTDELRDTLQWTPSRTTQAVRTARQLGITPDARAAYRDGTIPPESARVLADTLQHLDRADRDTVGPELLAAARTLDPVTFGRTCRARLAELNAHDEEPAGGRRDPLGPRPRRPPPAGTGSATAGPARTPTAPCGSPPDCPDSGPRRSRPRSRRPAPPTVSPARPAPRTSTPPTPWSRWPARRWTTAPHRPRTANVRT